MIHPLVNILVSLLALGGIAWLAFWILGQLGLPEPIGTVARVVIGVVLLLVLLGYVLGLMGNAPLLRVGGVPPLIG